MDLNDAQVIGIVLVILFILHIYSWIKAWYKGRWGRLKYSLKTSVNGIYPWLAMLMLAYMLSIAILPLPYITEKTNDIVASTPLAEIMIKGTPYAYAVIIIALAIWIAIKVNFKPLVKYNEQEKKWNDEAKAKLKERLPSWIPEWVLR